MIVMLALAMMAPAGRDHPHAPYFCRTVQGRLMATNGDPGIRIWERGTRHYLGLDVGQDLSLSTLPRNVRRLWTDGARRGSLFDASVYGSFRVCAWKPRRSGEMEIVRMIGAHNLKLGPYR